MTAKFMWYELLTSQPKRAEGFYKSVIGWKTGKMGEGDDAYTIYETERGGVAGMPVLGEDAPIKGEFWEGYIGVDDVDAYAERVEQKGGKIHLAPHDIPGVGRSAMVEDPQGAVFTLFKGNQPDGPPTGDGPGYPGWHELVTTDPKAGLDFYTDLFGWKPLDAMDMGPAGTYQIVAEDGSTPGAGIMRARPDTPRPHWTHYFNVESVEAAIERVKAGGGQVVAGPSEVPGGQWTAQGKDPQGAEFALVGPK